MPNRLRGSATVGIATTGHRAGQEIGLEGGPGDNKNYAKIGVSMSLGHDYVMFSDIVSKAPYPVRNAIEARIGAANPSTSSMTSCVRKVSEFR